MIQDIDNINVSLQDDNNVNVTVENDSITVNEGTPTDIAEIMHNEEIRQENEAQRIANEEQRIANEEDREEYITDLKQRVLDGEFDGEDGFSPIANVSKSGDTATITITDKNGTTTASISDGTDGTDGVDGVSPVVSMEKQGKVTTLTITDAAGTHTTEIRDGNDGSGTGDMLKATYDTNDNGVVDNAEKVNNHTVEIDVPANEVFTDTTYTAGTGIDITNNVISNTSTGSGKQEQLTFFISQSNPFILDDYQPGTYFFKTPENSSEGSLICFKATSTSPLHKGSDLNCSFADDYIFVQKKFSEALVGDIVASAKVGKWAQTLEGSAYSMDHFKETPTMLLIKASDSDVNIVFSNMYYNYSQLVLNGKENSFLRPQKYDNVVTYPGNYEFTNDSLIYKKYVDDLGNTKQNTIDSTHKLSSDLVNDTGNTNKFVTLSDMSYWNSKSDFSGDYNDLANKPTIPDELADLSSDSTHRVVTDTEKTTWSGKQDTIDSTHKLSADLVDDSTSTNKFFSGSYNDLTNKPTIPEVKTSKTISNTDTYSCNYVNGLTNAESVNPNNYITIDSSFTLASGSPTAYKVGNVVFYNFDITAGTITNGETVLGTCTNKLALTVWGTGRCMEAWPSTNLCPASLIAIPSGAFRIYTTQAGGRCAGTIILLVND